MTHGLKYLLVKWQKKKQMAAIGEEILLVCNLILERNKFEKFYFIFHFITSLRQLRFSLA